VPQRRAKFTDVFRSLDRQTRSLRNDGSRGSDVADGTAERADQEKAICRTGSDPSQRRVRRHPPCARRIAWDRLRGSPSRRADYTDYVSNPTVPAVLRHRYHTGVRLPDSAIGTPIEICVIRLRFATARQVPCNLRIFFLRVLCVSVVKFGRVQAARAFCRGSPSFGRHRLNRISQQYTI
jgi:hypothetical protein